MNKDQLIKYELRGSSKWSKSSNAKILNSKIFFSLSLVLSSISSTLSPAHNIFILVLPFLLIHPILLHLCMPKTVFPSFSLILNKPLTPLRRHIIPCYGVSARTLPAIVVFIAYWSTPWSQSSFYKPFFILLVPQALNPLPVTPSLRLMLSRENNFSFPIFPLHLKIFIFLLLFFPSTSKVLLLPVSNLSMEVLLQLYISVLTASISPSLLVFPVFKHSQDCF